jgi:hypothetical protein
MGSIYQRGIAHAQKYSIHMHYLIPSMWQILQYFHLHVPTILHQSIKRFLPFMSLKMSFNNILSLLKKFNVE